LAAGFLAFLAGFFFAAFFFAGFFFAVFFLAAFFFAGFLVNALFFLAFFAGFLAAFFAFFFVAMVKLLHQVKKRQLQQTRLAKPGLSGPHGMNPA